LSLRYVFSAIAGHDCTNFIQVGPASRASGVSYQYVYGMAQRALVAMRPHVSVEVLTLPNGKETLKICAQCVLDKYGSPSTQAGELLASPLIGYRSWFIRDNLLMSWGQSDFCWLPGGVQANCNKSHQVPWNKHSCGLYCLSKPNPNAYSGDVYGQVEMWGRYIEGDSGVRAEWGKPTALLCTDWKKADEIHRVASLYRVPAVHSIESLEEVDHGNWQDETGRGSSSEGDSGTESERASCRDAARGASTVKGLRHLCREGVISTSNLEEILFHSDDEDFET
jgi:hypothetical protein